MKTLFMLLKPAVQLVLVVLPGLFLVVLGILWLLHRRKNKDEPPQ